MHGLDAIAGHDVLGDLDGLAVRARQALAHDLQNRQAGRDLQQIREAGWAQAEGERVPDAFGLAAPFFADGAVAGSLTFTIPRFRADRIDPSALTTMLTDAARQVTALLSV